MKKSPSSTLSGAARNAASRELEPIAATKLVPPRGARRMIAREQLISRLLDARRKRCVVLEGPAGSGKTSILVAWRKTLLSLDYDIAWLSVADEDNEPARFFNCLLASLAEVDPGSVKDAALLMGRDSDDSAIEHWVITLVRGLSQRTRELALMLDDVHHLTDPRIVQALQWLLEYAPRHVHLTLVSRVALPLSLARLRSQGQLAEFDLRDLRFSATESEAFLREHVGAIDSRDAAVVHELTGGWVAGLQLFAVDIKAKQGAGYERVQVRDARAFASYFEREVLVRLDHDDLEMLTRMAICNRFCASLCAALMGQPHAAARIMMRLTRLDNDALFITQVSSHYDEAWYRVHPLLREVLLVRWEARPAAERLALHAAAWRWFDDHGQVDDAVRHAVQAGESGAAADLIEQCAPDMLARGDLGQLWGLLRRLPAQERQSRIPLRLTIGRLELYARDIEAFLTTLEGLERDMAMLDAGQCDVVTLFRAGLAMQRDDSESVAGLLPDLQRIPIDDNDQNVTGRANIISWMYMYRGEFDKARQVLSDGAGHAGSPRSSLIGKCLGGMAHELQGQIIQAERIFREVLQEAEMRGGPFVSLACMAAGLLGDALHESNDPNAAIRQLEGRIDLIERVSIPDTVLRALLVLSNAHWLEGRRMEARAYLDRLDDYALRHKLDRLRSYALALRMSWCLKEDDAAAAGAALADLRRLGELHANAPLGTLWEIGLNAGCAEAAMLLHRRDYKGAAELIKTQVARAETGGRWRRVASLRMQLALCEWRSECHQAADEQLVQALTLGHRLGLVRTLLDASPGVTEMLQALDEESLDPVLTFYTQRLRDGATGDGNFDGKRPAGMPGALFRGPGALRALSDREIEVLQLLAQAMPNKKIARALGVSPETVKWHLKNIFGKLGVAGRDEAVSRMRDLDGPATD